MRERLNKMRTLSIGAADKVFGHTPYAIEVSLLLGRPVVRVSYRDFKTEEMVERELRFLLGDGFDFRIYRTFSESVVKEFLFNLYRQTGRYGHGFHAQVDAAISDKVFP